jgi:segregation and condensation protein A
MAEPFDFEATADRTSSDPTLVVDVDGFEGPLDLLLELARRHKVDLTRISILALAEQYLAFIEEARRLRLELAADYLVMAAWLAFLKSRLLLPDPPAGEDLPAADLAAALAFRLRRLEAMREASRALQERPQLGREVFARGMPEAIHGATVSRYEASLYDLLSAYARQRQKCALAHVRLPARNVWTLSQAREALEKMLGPGVEWERLDRVLEDYWGEPAMRPTIRASSFSASLELAKEGRLDLRQEGPFAPIYLRTRTVATGG